jgi:hypothetical protein
VILTFTVNCDIVIRFRRYRERRVHFFLFCASGLDFGGTEGVGFCFHVLRFRTRFSTVSRALSLVFIFCAFGSVFDGTEDVKSSFYDLRSLTHFRRSSGPDIFRENKNKELLVNRGAGSDISYNISDG